MAVQRVGLLLFFVVGALLAGCGGNSGGIEASGVWGRESPSMAQNGAFYLELRNNGDADDALVAVQTTACSQVELHESSMDDHDVMSMDPVEGGRIPLPAGETISLEPGGLHVMCLGVVEPFVSGERIPLVLHFEQHEPLEVEAEIRRDAP
ncbi:MAG: copper chaperone PCu(A)C [Chloroflexi bacterium]|nr:copper chaperone PCu(A)C [Chloroflexota bacterium]